jgi:phenylacetate-CoA ligase
MRRLKNTELVDGFAFDETTVERARMFLDANDQVSIYGYSSLLEQLADAFRNQGLSVPAGKVQAVWNGAEAVTAEQSEAFHAVFGREIQNQYGGREFGALAYQTSDSDGLNLLRPNVFAEIVDDAGQPCVPGEIGRIVLTTLIGKGTPFLRYENGDLGTYAANGVDESGIFKLSSLEGRLSGMVRLNGGRVVHNAFWGMLIKEFAGVDQFQVRQARDRSIAILLKGERISPVDEQRLRMLLENTLKETPLTISWVDKIPLTREGKLIQVHSDVDAAS